MHRERMRSGNSRFRIAAQRRHVKTNAWDCAKKRGRRARESEKIGWEGTKGWEIREDGSRMFERREEGGLYSCEKRQYI
jgi:hypothetical protein